MLNHGCDENLNIKQSSNTIVPHDCVTPETEQNNFFDQEFKVFSSSKQSKLGKSGWSIFTPHERRDEIALALEDLPKEWALTPLNGKRPFLANWNKEGCDRERIANLLLNGEQTKSRKTGNDYTRFASGFGLLTGDTSGGLIAIDQDGQRAIDLLETWFAAVGEQRTKTVSWTSGTAGKRQDLFRVPAVIRQYLKDFTNFKIKLEKQELDFRYNGVQSALPPSYHPSTGAYKWIHSPSDCKVAELPGWLCEKLLRINERQKAEKRIMEPPKIPDVEISTSKSSNGDGFGLVGWLHEMQSKSDPTQLFNHPKHDWRGGSEKWKGAPCDREEEWGEVAIFKNSLGKFVLKDFSTGIAIDALHYEAKINCGLSDYPKGKDWINCLRSLASRMGWEFPESENSKEKYLAAIAEEQKRLNGLDTSKFAKVIEFSSKYIPKEEVEKILPTESGYMLTSDAPMGSGKTTLLKHLYQGCKVTGIIPTIALGRGLGHESGFNLIMRENVGLDSSNSYDNLLLEQEQRLAICYPSLWRVANRKGDVLILDETVGGFEFLLDSGHCNKNGRRSDNIAALINLIRNHTIIVLSDAFLNNFVVDFVKKIRNDLDIYHVTKKVEKRERSVYKISIEFLENEIIKRLEDREKIAIAADSKERVRALKSKYISLGYKPPSIYREIAGEPFIQQILANPTEELKKIDHNVLIYSPTIGSGVNIVIDYDAVFAINCHLPATNFVQMPGRVRTNNPFYYCVENEVSIEGCQSFLPSEQEKWLYNNLDGNIVNQLVQSEANKLSKVIGEDSGLSLSLAWSRISEERSENEIVKLVADLRAFKAWNLKDKDEKVHALLKKQGYQVIAIIPENKADSIPTLEALGYTVQLENKQSFTPDSSEDTKEFRDINRGIDAEIVIKAELITEDEFKSLQKKTSLSFIESNKSKRYLLEKNLPGFIEFLGEESTNSYLELELKDRGHWLRGVRNFTTLKQIESQAVIEKRSISKIVERWETQNILTLQDAAYLKTAAYNFLLKDLKLFEELDFTGEKEYTSKDLKQLVERWTSTAKKLTSLRQWFNLGKVKRDPDKNLGGADKKWIDKLLDRFAFELRKVKTVHGIVHYSIQQKKLSKDFVLKNGFREFVENIWEIKIAERLAAKNIGEESLGEGSPDIVNTQPVYPHPEKKKKDVAQDTHQYSGFDPTDGTMPDDAIREWWTGTTPQERSAIVHYQLGLERAGKLAKILGLEIKKFFALLDSENESWELAT